MGALHARADQPHLDQQSGARVYLKCENLQRISVQVSRSHECSAASRRSDQEKIAENALPGMNVLVVDNNEINREIFAEMLKNWGMNATLAEGGRAALEAGNRQEKRPPISIWCFWTRHAEHRRLPGLAATPGDSGARGARWSCCSPRTVTWRMRSAAGSSA